MTHSGGKPHTNVGDKGQRYEVTFFDEEVNLRRVFGWSEDYEGAVKTKSKHSENNRSWRDFEGFIDQASKNSMYAGE